MDKETPPTAADCGPGRQTGWYLVGRAGDLTPGAQMRRLFMGQPVLIGRTTGRQVFAFRDVCPHRLVPLSAGRQVQTDGETTVECPYHGWRFGTDGVCRRIPSLMEEDPYDPADFRVQAYRVAEHVGGLYLSQGDDDSALPGLGGLSAGPDVWESAAINPVSTSPGALPSALEALGWRIGPGGEHRPASLAMERLCKRGGRLQPAESAPGWRCERILTELGCLTVLTALTPEDGQAQRAHIAVWWRGLGLFTPGKWDVRSVARHYLRRLNG